MPDLSNYQIQDFIPFSREVYWATLQNYTESIWPAQVLWVVASVVSLILIVKNRGIPWLMSVVGAAWIFVGVVFHYQYFQAINWAAVYFSGLFTLQGIVLVVSGWLSRGLRASTPSKLKRRLGLTIFLGAAFIPHTEPTLLFGWGAAQTALGTIGLLVTRRQTPRNALLLILPSLWLMLTGLIHMGMR